MAISSTSEVVNHAEKWSADAQEEFTRKSLLHGRLKVKQDFSDARKVHVTTMNTLPMNDYKREGENRFGETQEIGDTVQTLEMTQEKSYSGSLDKLNTMDQAIKKAGRFTRLQLNKVVIPMKDTYGFRVLAKKAGRIGTDSAALTKDNIFDHIDAAREWCVNNDVPIEEGTWFTNVKIKSLLNKTELFINARELGAQSFIKGQIGVIEGAPAVEVPSYRMPAGVNFIYVHQMAACSPSKLEEVFIRTNAKGYSGPVVEGLFYYDTFVMGNKAEGVYADITTGGGVSVLANPTVNAGTGAVTGVTAPAQAKYTLDGSDPRYSKSAMHYTGLPVVTSGMVMKVYQFNDTDPKVYPSPVVTVTIT